MGEGQGEDRFTGTSEACEERQFGMIERALEVRNLDLIPAGTLSLGKSLNLPELQYLYKWGKSYAYSIGFLWETNKYIYIYIYIYINSLKIKC